MDTSETKMYRW